MDARALETVDAGCIGDEDRIGAADEKAAFDHPDDPADALLKPRWIGDGAKVAIKNAVAAVGDERLARRRQAQLRAGAQHFEGRTGGFQPESDDLHGNRRRGAEPVHQLGPIGDDCEAPARRGDDLLPQQRSAPSLDQVERAALHLVGAVDGKIDAPVLAEGSQRNARCRRLGRRPFRRGDAQETQALAVTAGERFDGEGRRRAGAEPDDHAILDQLNRRFRGGALLSVPLLWVWGRRAHDGPPPRWRSRGWPRWPPHNPQRRK